MPIHATAPSSRWYSAARSKAYVTKRTGGTKANLDVLRRLKRYTAREIYPLLLEALTEAEPDLARAA